MTLRFWLAFPAASLALACAAQGPDAGPIPQQTTTHVTTPEQPGNRIRLTHDPNVAYDTVDASLDRVWLALPTVYEQLEIDVTVADTGAGWRMGNPGFRARRLEGSRLSQFLDCGHSMTGAAYADEYEVSMLVLVTLLDAGEGRTLMQTQVEATATPRFVSGNPVHCTSKRTLERRIGDLVLRTLAREEAAQDG